MKERRIRVDSDKMKWHIQHYRRKGYEATKVEIAPISGKIKFAVLVGEDEKIIIQPKVLQKYNRLECKREEKS